MAIHADGGSSWWDSPAEGNQTATLIIPAVDWRNGFRYRCVVSNSAGSATSGAATLTVLASSIPEITGHPMSASLVEGDTAYFTVTATGGGLSYQWQYSADGGSSWWDSPAEGNQTATLIIPAVDWRSGFRYRCVVSNSAGTAYSNPATLTVGTDFFTVNNVTYQK